MNSGCRFSVKTKEAKNIKKFLGVFYFSPFLFLFTEGTKARGNLKVEKLKSVFLRKKRGMGTSRGLKDLKLRVITRFIGFLDRLKKIGGNCD